MDSFDGPIVVPLDGSRNSENALPHAALLSRWYEQPVRLIHVVEQDDIEGDVDLPKARAAFDPYAREVAESYGAAEFGVETYVAEGSAGNEILEYAEGTGASCIAIASHGRGGFRSNLAGSVADKVARASKRPVVFVPGRDLVATPEYRQIVVGVDGSAEAERGLATARELAQRSRAELTLVRAYTAVPPVGVEFGYYPQDTVAAIKSNAVDYLERTAGEREHTRLLQGNAAWAIEEVAEAIGADLVAVTSHGKGFAARIALGSTTNQLMHSLHRPLLIVPAAGE